MGSCQPPGAEMNLCCGAGRLGGKGIFWTDQRYKYLVGLKAKADNRFQAIHWEQGLHSDQLWPNAPTFKRFSEKGPVLPAPQPW